MVCCLRKIIKMPLPCKYKPEMCQIVVDKMAEGAGKYELCAELGISFRTWQNYRERYPEFDEAVARGEELSRAWWLSQGRLALRDKEFSYTGWYMNMKNRFGWRDNQDMTIKGDKDNPIQHKHSVEFSKMTDDELNQYIDQAKKG